MKIDRDSSRFKQIVRGKIRDNLRKYITHGEMIGRKGNDLVSIPLPQLDVPHFRYGQNGRGGVGQGDGEVGQPIASGDPDGDGQGQAGSDAGQHVLEVDVTLEELAAILGDELQLPRIEPKGKANIEQDKVRYTSTSKPSSGSSAKAPTALTSRALSPTRMTAATARGRASPSPSPTPSSST
jgi:uncharacterized sporulation protein YeaH/YhbH (DUF444 family)